MKHLRVPSSLSLFSLPRAPLAALLAAGLALTACGGGGGGAAPTPPPPEAVVTAVLAEASVLEGTSSTGTGRTSDLVFEVSFNQAVVSRLELRVSTVSAAKAGSPNTPGAATGGKSCSDGVDYIELKDEAVVFAAKADSGRITVQVCQDSDFEPNETLFVTWKPVGGTEATVKGVILNDDAGGLNSTGATSMLGGLNAFGRDVNSLTNSNADGALGFSFDATASSGCIKDKVTGLLWQKEWSATPVVFSSLIDRVNKANQDSGECGIKTWRVPRTRELTSLLNYSLGGGAITDPPMNADALLSAPMYGTFWSAEQFDISPLQAWVVSPGDGGAVALVSATSSNLLRLVSDGTLPPSCENARARFDVRSSLNTSVPEGVVYDNKNGLMWKRCTEGTGCNQNTMTLNTDRLSDSDASTYLSNWLKNINNNPSTLGAGFDDWRIPTVKELASLVDRCEYRPAIHKDSFPDTIPMAYISSTVDAKNNNRFWYVNFFDGSVGVNGPQGRSLRLVRAGQ
jgi:hypothetical protein